MKTYKQIYNQLNKAGVIDKLCIAGGNKIDIVKAIEYLEYFVGSSTFKGKTYWVTGRNETVSKVVAEYGKLQLANPKCKFVKEYDYMVRNA